MDAYKAQLECFKIIVKRGFRGKYCQIDESKCFITPDEYRGFVFNNKELLVDLAKLSTLSDCEFLKKTERDKEFTLSKHILNYDLYPVQKLVCKELGCHAWVRPEFLKYFQFPVIYGSGPQERFLIYEDMGRQIELAGIVLPVRIAEEEENA